MDNPAIIQALITIATAGGTIAVLRSQIKSQQDQIESMKKFMDIFKLDDIEKYVAINKKTSEQATKLAIEATVSQTLNSEQMKQLVSQTFDDLFDSRIDKELKDRGQELFDSIIDSLANFTGDERAETIKEIYPLNADAIFAEFERIEKEDPDFLKKSRESYLKSLPDKSSPDGK